VYVLSDIVSQPDRKLNLWPFDDSDGGHTDSAVDLGPATAYSVDGPTQAKAKILDSNSDCDDVYIAAHDPDSVPATQSALLDRCFVQNGYVPAGDRLPELHGDSGEYQAVLGVLDGRQAARQHPLPST